MADPSIKFGKQQVTFNSQFNGTSKDLAGIKGNKNMESIFNKYDTNHDGVLDSTEYAKIQNDITAAAGKNGRLGKQEAANMLQGTNASREDLAKFIDTLNKENDNIADVKYENGQTTVTYKPEDGQSAHTETYSTVKDGNTYKNVLRSKSFTQDGKQTTINYQQDGESPSSMEVVDGNITTTTVYEGTGADNKPTFETAVDNNNHSTTTTEFVADGETIKSKVRVTDAVTEFLDPEHNDRPTKQLTDKGNGVIETDVYTYDDTAQTKTVVHSDANGKEKTSVTTDKDGNPIREVTYGDYDGTTTYAQRTETIVETGSDGQKHYYKAVTRNDTNKTVLSKFETNAEGEPIDTKYTVGNGENWYGIVQAKYGITDHKTTMEVVHQLKDSAGVRRSATTMPTEITLPPTVTVNGKDYTLNLDAKLDDISVIPQNIDAPAANPPESAKDLTSAQMDDIKKITKPDLSQYTKKAEDPVDTPVAQSDGKYVKFDAQGNVTEIYADKDHADAGHNEYYFGNDGTWNHGTYNDKGNLTQLVFYNDKNEITEIGTGSYNDDGTQGTYVIHNPDGTVERSWVQEFNGQGKANDGGEWGAKGTLTKRTEYTAGEDPVVYVYRYNNDNDRARCLTYDKDGKLTDVTQYELDQNGWLKGDGITEKI